MFKHLIICNLLPVCRQAGSIVIRSTSLRSSALRLLRLEEITLSVIEWVI